MMSGQPIDEPEDELQQALLMNAQLKAMIAEQARSAKPPSMPQSTQRGQAQPHQDKTFNPLQKQEIARGNEMLLLRMMQIDNESRKGGGFSRNQGYCKNHLSSASINRSRQQNRINEENQKIAGRLQNVRTSSLGRSGTSIAGGNQRSRSVDAGRLTRAPLVKPHGKPRLQQPEWQS
eukprot:gnl/MRDRNA2_/MRDRNA2_60075_c0_seq1.p1 gnl/MRDRNA2_/MRDRNA2_60075_c0~~gnl/MRDRNA2_/MRDRNA2_60075_c0_seq1.p1  ORF type:complete len:177 (-),score=39.62 gnl/MRDRNA2_/MRDRNA2_60075_c0_seq1:149-679(-)